MAISVPPSPRWNDEELQYPNIQQASDYITCQIWREEVSEHLNYLKKICRHKFGTCEFGRTSESKKQKKIGCIMCTSLCSESILQHKIKEKRYNMNTDTWDEIVEWYFDEEEDDTDDEQIEFEKKMQLIRTDSGNTIFENSYLESLKDIKV